MKFTTRERAFRTVLSALLSSNLSVTELRELSDDLLDDREFLLQMCSALKENSRILSRTDSQSDGPIGSPQEAWLKDMLSLAKKRRLAKRDLTAILSVIYPSIPTEYLQGARTVNEILRYVSWSAPDQVRAELRTRLQPDAGSGDEYLTGIMRRRITRTEL